METKEILEYFNKLFTLKDNPGMIKLEYILNTDEITRTMLSDYLSHKFLTEREYKSEFVGKVYFFNDYTFSHFLIIIDYLAKKKKLRGRKGFLELIQSRVDDINLKFYIEGMHLIESNSSLDHFVSHIFCYNWKPYGIQAVDSSKDCNDKFDPIHFDPPNDGLPEFATECKTNYKINAKQSFASFLYELRCNYAHNGINASLHGGILIKGDKLFDYTFGERLGLVGLEQLFFPVLWE